MDGQSAYFVKTFTQVGRRSCGAALNEGFHGVVKDNTGFGKMRVSGSRNLMVHNGIHLLAFLAVGPLFKIQHGVATELMGLRHLIV